MSDSPQRLSSFRIWAGIILLIIGLMTLFEGLSALIPTWVFNWSVFVLIAGTLIIVRRGLSSPFGPILFCIGLFNTIDEAFLSYDSQPTLGGILIGTAIYMIAGRKKAERLSPPWGSAQPFERKNTSKTAPPAADASHATTNGFVATEEPKPSIINPDSTTEVPYVEITDTSDADNEVSSDTTNPSPVAEEAKTPQEEPAPKPEETPEYINITNVLGGSKKRVESRNFKGGEALSFMGGCEIDLSQSDIQGRVTLDITQILGGTKLIVPSHWEVVSEMSSILGGIDDKRILAPHLKTGQKTLVLKGVSLLGGIDIRTY